jgi:hypothetical protein
MDAQHLAELQANGWTVIPGFVDLDTCRRAREAIDAWLGPATAAVDAASDLGDAALCGSGNYVHSIAHPNPTMAVLAGVSAGNIITAGFFLCAVSSQW